MKIAIMSISILGLAVLGLLLLDRGSQDVSFPGVGDVEDAARPADFSVDASADTTVDSPGDLEAGAEVSAEADTERPAADEAFDPRESLRADSPAPRTLPPPLPLPAPDELRAPGTGLRDQLDQLIDSEARDARWAAETESRILSEISQLPGLSASLIEVNCRTIHCMVRITLPAQPPPAQPELTVMTADGHPVFVGAAALELETVALLSLRGPSGLPQFVTYLRRGAEATTQSVAEGS
ncbi:MAG TPA: hypothetical protein VMR74_07620 [Gammaproteobacteria bacterium]|nr:hypothetical protein [Gammaproteobacteria bacterium]